MTYLPAPYESAQQDDMAAALGAGLTISTAAVTSWVLGSFGYDSIRSIVESIDHGADFEDIPADVLVPTAGWSVAVVFMVLGALMTAGLVQCISGGNVLTLAAGTSGGAGPRG